MHYNSHRCHHSHWIYTDFINPKIIYKDLFTSLQLSILSGVHIQETKGIQSSLSARKKRKKHFHENIIKATPPTINNNPTINQHWRYVLKGE
jgi:hypothetical protein